MRLALCFLFCLVGSSASWGQEPKLVHVLSGHKSSVGIVVFSPDGKLLASSQDGGEVRLWDVSSGKNLAVLYRELNGVRHHCGSLAFSPDGKLLAGGVEGRWVVLWDTAKCAKVGIIEASEFHDYSSCLAFQPNGKTLVSQSRDSDGKLVIAISDVATLKNTGAIKVNVGRHGDMAFSPDCRFFALGPFFSQFVHRDVMELYETATGKKLTTFQGHDHAALALTFSPDGKMLAAAVEQSVKLWDVATGKHLSTFAISSPTSTYPGVKGSFGNYVYCIAFSPDSKIITFGNSGEPVVELCDVTTGKKITALKGNPLDKRDGIDSIAISPDGKMLAAGRSAGSGNWDETIELWDIGGVNKLNTMSTDTKK